MRLTLIMSCFCTVFAFCLCTPSCVQSSHRPVWSRIWSLISLTHYNPPAFFFFYHSIHKSQPNTHQGEKQDELYLNLVLEYVPETVYSISRHHQKSKIPLPLLYVKLYLYQLSRALSHIHSLGICHRDIKPQNLLVNPENQQLKLCDFGSAKALVRGEPNVSYICSRYYRAPELIFGSTDYSTAIDIWSQGEYDCWIISRTVVRCFVFWLAGGTECNDVVALTCVLSILGCRLRRSWIAAWAAIISRWFGCWPISWNHQGQL